MKDAARVLRVTTWDHQGTCKEKYLGTLLAVTLRILGGTAEGLKVHEEVWKFYSLLAVSSA